MRERGGARERNERIVILPVAMLLALNPLLQIRAVLKRLMQNHNPTLTSGSQSPFDVSGCRRDWIDCMYRVLNVRSDIVEVPGARPATDHVPIVRSTSRTRSGTLTGGSVLCATAGATYKA